MMACALCGDQRSSLKLASGNRCPGCGHTERESTKTKLADLPVENTKLREWVDRGDYHYMRAARKADVILNKDGDFLIREEDRAIVGNVGSPERGAAMLRRMVSNKAISDAREALFQLYTAEQWTEEDGAKADELVKTLSSALGKPERWVKEWAAENAEAINQGIQ